MIVTDPRGYLAAIGDRRMVPCPQGYLSARSKAAAGNQEENLDEQDTKGINEEAPRACFQGDT